MKAIVAEIIQIALGRRTVLSHNPSEEEWTSIYELCRRQMILGIALAGIQKLNRKSICLPDKLYYQWIAIALRISKKNEILDARCVELQQKLKNDGFDSCILKGQGVARYYYDDIRKLRQSGDIDVWMKGSDCEVLEYVNKKTPNREFDRKHTHFNIFIDAIVETHWWPSYPSDPFVRSRVLDFYKNQVDAQCHNRINITSSDTITVPVVRFQVIHLIGHILSHFVYEGVALKQLLDLYFVLVNGGLSSRDKTEVLRLIKSFGYAKITPALMWVLNEVFDMDATYMLCKPDEKCGKELLDCVMKDDRSTTMVRKAIRRIGLIKYDPIGILYSPITKFQAYIWKRQMIKKYNL